jgi:hypothetical protein
MSNLSTLPKGDSAWLLRKAIQRVMQQVSVLETNIGASTTGNSANTQVIFNDNGILRGDPDLIFNTALNKLVVTNLEATAALTVGTTATITGNLTVDTSTFAVDASNNRVFVGTAPISTAYPFYVTRGGTAGSIAQFTDGTAQTLTIDSAAGGLLVGNANNGYLEFVANGLAQYRIAPLGVFSWYDGAGGTRMTLNSTGLGVGVTPITGHRISSVGPIGLSGGPNSYVANGNYCSMYYTDGSGASFPFLEYGNLVIQPRNERNVVIATAPTAGNHVARVVVKLGGQVRFVPLAADPSGAESGDVYYNSTSNKLKCYNGTTWNDLF